MNTEKTREELIEEIDKLEDKIDDMESEIDTKNDEIWRLEDTIDEMESDIDELKQGAKGVGQFSDEIFESQNLGKPVKIGVYGWKDVYISIGK